MATQEVNGYFHDNGLYPNLVTLMVARSQQVFQGPNESQTGEELLRTWIQYRDVPDVEAVWLSPARVTRGGGIRIKKGGKWHVLCDDMTEA